MTIIKVLPHSLLETPLQHVAQQTNCLTVRPHGLSKSISHAFHVDPYSQRAPVTPSRNLTCARDADIPGTIRVLESPKVFRGGKIPKLKQKKVICMFAQWAPGKATDSGQRWSYPASIGDKGPYEDTRASRLEWFRECIRQLDELGLEDPVAVPRYIGCGLAGGRWADYRAVLAAAETKFVVYENKQ